MQKRWIRIAAAVGGIFVLLLVIIPLFIHADAFRPAIENQLSSSLNRKVSIGSLSFSLLAGSLEAKNIAIADDPAFGSAPFIEAKSLAIGVEVGPLIFHRKVNITRLTLEEPSIHLLHAANGLWNFSTIGGASTSKAPQQPSTLPDLTVKELRIKDGSASVANVPEIRKPLVYSAINLTVQNFTFRSAFPFELSAALPASGAMSLKGNAGPFSQNNAADTPFKAALSLKHFDPVAAGILDQGKGISMVLDIDSDLTSRNSTLTSSGKIKASHLQLARTGTPTTQPIDIDFAVSQNIDTRSGKLANLSVKTGSAAAYAYGTFQQSPQDILLNLHLNAPNLPIDQLLQLLPAFGVQLPSGSQLRGGTLSANLAITGPASATTIAGPVEVDNTTLAGFDLGSKIQGLNLFKSGGGTQIQTLKATVNAAPQLTQLNNIYGNLPQLGSATGNGTVTPTGAIDFKLVATLSSNNVVGAAANQAINQVSSFVGGFLHPKSKPTANSNRGIPITITGTPSNPVIRANVVGMFK